MPHDDHVEPLLADIIDHLVPEAFARPTAAERVAREPVALSGLPRSRSWATFDRWVDDRLLGALDRTAYGGAVTVVETSDGGLLRRYVDCGCGGLRCATDPARRELAAAGEPWVFAADLVRPAPRWEVRRDRDGEVDEEVLVAPPDARWSAPWFAEARGHGVAATRAGVLWLDGEVVLDATRMAPREHEITRHFHGLLLRHPARRRWPLRGGGR